MSTLTDVSPIVAARHPGQFALLMALGVVQVLLMGLFLLCSVRLAWIFLKSWFRFTVEVIRFPLRVFDMCDRIIGGKTVARKPAQC